MNTTPLSATRDMPEPAEQIEQISLFDSLSRWALYALIAVTPIFFIPSVAAPFQFSKSMLIAVLVTFGFIFFVIGRLQHQRLSVIIEPLLLASFAVPIAYVLSAVLSSAHMPFVGERLGPDSAAFILFATLALVLAAHVLKSKADLLGAYLSFLGGSILVAVFYGLHLLLGSRFPSFNIFLTTEAGPLGTFNTVGMFFGLVVVLLLITLVGLGLPRKPRFLVVGSLGVALFFLMVTNIALVWWLVGIVALGVLVYGVMRTSFTRGNDEDEDESSSQSTALIASFTVLAISLAFIFVSSALTSSVANYFKVGELDIRPSFSATLDIAKESFREHPLFGSGPGTFPKVWAQHRPDVLNQTVAWNVDFVDGVGLIPTSVVTTGAVGLLAWVVFLGWFVFAGVRALLLSQVHDEVSYYLMLSSFVAALYLWILAVMMVPGVLMYLLAFVFSGICIATLRLSDRGIREYSLIFKDRPKVGFVTVLGLTVTLLVSIVSMFTLTERYVAAFHFQRAVAAFNQSAEVNDTLDPLTRAISLDERDTYHRLLSSVALARLNQIINANPEPNDEARAQFQSVLEQAIISADRAVALDDSDYANWLQLAQVYRFVASLKIEGGYDNAKRAYDEALRLRPNSPNILLEMAQLELAHEQPDPAMVFLQEALSLRPNYSDAMFLLAQIQLSKDDLPAAISSVESAVTFSPNNPLAHFQLGLLRYSDAQYDRAANAFERAITLAPDYANARYFLGLSYYWTDHRDKAIEQFEIVSKLNPDIQELHDIIANMQQGLDPFSGTAIANPPVAPEPDVRELSGLPIPEEDPELQETPKDAIAE